MLLLSGSLFSVLADKQHYLDPGSGSFLIQLLIAGLAGITIVLGSQWRKIKKLFRKNKAEEDEQIESLDSDKSAAPSDAATVVQPAELSVKLPKKCPTCGAPVHPKKVKWLDKDTAECTNCGMLIECK